MPANINSVVLLDTKLVAKFSFHRKKVLVFNLNFIQNFSLNLMPINLCVLLLEQENSTETKKIQQEFS